MRRVSIIALVALGISATDSVGQPPKLDVNGDPLPPGAVARFGSARLMHDAKAVAFLDAKTLVSFGESVRVWDATSGKLLREHPDKLMDETQRAAFSGDGKTLVTIHRYNEFRVWNATSGKLIREIKADEPFDANSERTPGWALSVSADGKRFASNAESAGRIHVWAVKDDAKLAKVDVDDRIMLLTLAPDGSHVAALLDTRSEGPVLAVWDAGTGKRTLRKKLDLPGPLALAFSPDGGRLAVGGNRDAYAVFTVGGQELWKGPAKNWTEALFFAPDSQLVLITLKEGSPGAQVHLIDSRGTTKRQWSMRTDRVRRMAMSPDSKLLAVADSGRIRVWNVGEGREIVYGPGHVGGLTAACVTPDGKQIVTSGGLDDDVLLWDIATAREVRRFGAHTGGCTGVAVSPDGRCIVSSSADNTVRSWETATGKQLAKVDSEGYVWSLGFTAGGDVVAISRSKDYKSTLFAISNGRRDVITDDLTASATLTACPDSRVLLVESGHQIRAGETVWSLSIREARGSRAYFHADVGRDPPIQIAKSRDGRSLATSDSKATIKVWEILTGQQQVELNPTRMARLETPLPAFAPDGRTFVTVDPHEPVFYLWDLATGKEFATIRGHEVPIMTLGFTPDGRRLITGSRDGTVLAWDMTLPAHRPSPLAAARLSREELHRHWEQLRGTAVEAYRAKWALAADPDGTVAFLRGQFAPGKTAEVEQIRQWIGELESPTFAVREAAERGLRANVDQADTELRAALAKATGEGRRRIERIVEAGTQVPAPDLLRELRAVEILDHIGSKPAIDALRQLTHDKVRYRVAREAGATLARRGPN